MLVGLWLLTQLSPETFLFGTGDLRHLLEITPAVPYAPHSFLLIETAIVVCNTVAIGLIFFALLVGRKSSLVLLSSFLALALAIRTLAAAILVGPQQALVWLTPGAMLGLMIGGAAPACCCCRPCPGAYCLRRAGADGRNSSGQPDAAQSLFRKQPWQPGGRATSLNFNGLTRLTASLWPFPCTTVSDARRAEKAVRRKE